MTHAISAEATSIAESSRPCHVAQQSSREAETAVMLAVPWSTVKLDRKSLSNLARRDTELSHHRLAHGGLGSESAFVGDLL